MITIEDVMNARLQIADLCKVTPLLHSTLLSKSCGNQLLIKGEHLQKTGAFKLRGAVNKVKTLKSQGVKHVVAASSGNHGQAVAYVAKQLGMEATIVVPETVPRCKEQAIRLYEATVVHRGITSAERINWAKQYCDEVGAALVLPYDDELVMAGQGTIGLELVEQFDEIDTIYVPVGGGGLLAGIAIAIKQLKPSIQLIGAEPLLANDTYLSLQEGKRVTIPPSTTLADGLRTNTPGELTFPILQHYLDDMVLISEEEMGAAFYATMLYLKHVVEPSAAIAIAGAMAHPPKGKKIVAIASGGNVDPMVIPQLLQLTQMLD